ncbi:MAG: amino acid ABC transporter substrate-binding protein [Deltaproteobacteria bacterium]|nr:MAG: amino acid ABC transporter substrate-binding protein [Deltaproteobacteria bacterium]
MNSKEKSLKLAVCLVLFALLMAFPLAAHAKDKIVIGQAASLSGPLGGDYTFACAPVYHVWVKDVNAAGGIYVKEYGKKLPVELKVYDDKSDISTMTRLLEKLILEEKVDFVFCPWGTAFTLAAAPVANKHGYILISNGAGAMKLKDFAADLPYYFQTLNFAETQVPALVDILEELGVKKVATICHDDLHGAENSAAAVPALTDRGFEVVINESYPMGVKDLSPLLKRAKSLNADAFIGFSYPGEVMLATGQAIELGINFKVFGFTVGPAFTFYPEAFGPLAEGVIGGGAWNEKTSPGAKAFAEHFKEVMGKPVNNYWGALYWYSALQHFQQSIEKAGTLNQKKIRDIMAKEKFDTALGPFWYDERRIFVNHPGEWGQWQKGVFEVIDPGPKRTAPPIVKPDWPKKK